MARARRKSPPRRSQAARGRGWRWFALLLGLAVLTLITRPGIERVVREIDRTADMRRVETFAPLLREAAERAQLARYGFDANVLAAFMLAESSGRIDAVSSAGALGLFQLMLPTARERADVLGLPEPSRADLLSKPELNARLAAEYVSWLAKRYDGDLEQIAIAYNAGPGRLDGWMREAGGYAPWRAQRARAGDSQVLAYAAKIARYRALFAERGVIQPQLDPPVRDHPPAPEHGAPPVLASEVASEVVLYGPPVPSRPNVDAVVVDPPAAPPR